MKLLDPKRLRPPLILIAVVMLVEGSGFLRFVLAAEPLSKNLALTKLPQPATAKVDFVRDIQPLLVERCVKCHGPDKQKADLRLDGKSRAMRGGDSGTVIEPGKSAESRLIHLVAGLEPDTLMPPKGEPLTTNQIAMLRAWIDQGANWPEDLKKARSAHWSLQPLRSPAIPGNAGNPIDVLINARLAKEGLTLSPEADRTTLIRRLSFDLIGLPPSPEEIEAFVKNTSPNAYAELVDRLLASPHYGERWGRHWLDIARYTESQGFEYDHLRENAWQYRDYVIKSFNDDKPYDRFMKEQIAGDVMEPVTTDGMIGPSLLVCGPWDAAGNMQANATQRAIARDDELEDLIGVVGQSFLGLTINCARCHTHKFDPIPHEEYYRIKSIFEGVKHGERPIDRLMESKAQAARLAALRKEITRFEQEVAQIESEGWKLAAAKYSTDRPSQNLTPFLRWTFDGTANATPPGSLNGGASIANGILLLPKEGAYFQSSPLPRDIREKTLEAWVSLADLKQGGGAPISIEADDGSSFDAIVFGERQPKKWTAGSTGFVRTKDLDAHEENAAPDVSIYMAIVYRADNSITVYRNGEPYGATYTPGNSLQTFYAGKSHVVLGMRHKGGGRPWLTGKIRQAALYDRALSATEVAASFRTGGFSIPPSEILASLTPDQQVARNTALSNLKHSRESLDAIKPIPVSVSYVGTRVQPPPTHRLKRGEVTSPDEVVTPGALSAIVDLNPDFGLPADAPEAQRRLKFADWLADPRNPLPARVMANRIWHLHFGQGLVATPNDFGVSGARPSHPELLDWLAVKLIENKWSVKSLHRLIVNSATYRQVSTFNEKAAAKDADNQMLWRFAPKRLESEAVRDAMLAVSGQLNLAVGGPSFRPFTVTQFNASFYHLVDRPEPEFNRRTVYRVNVNSGKDPLLEAFDCPDPSVKTPRRGVTTTPLQALELMNNSFVQRQAKHLAERAMKDAGANTNAAIQIAYLLAIGRRPTADEISRASAAVQERGLASVCWALLNSTEFVYVK